MARRMSSDQWVRSRSPETWFLLIALSLVVSVVSQSGLVGPPTEAHAAATEYRLRFGAADPTRYVPPVPMPGGPECPTGAGTNPIPRAHFRDPVDTPGGRVESLSPEDLALGQIVAFEMGIKAGGDAMLDGGVVTVTAFWSTHTTTGAAFGYDGAHGVLCAFVDRGDGAHVDPSGDASVAGYDWTVDADEILGTFEIAGLDADDDVVLEVWVVLDEAIPPDAHGAVEAGFAAAAAGDGRRINTGNQTVWLTDVARFFTADADLSVTQTDSPDPAVAGGSVTYQVTVENEGPAVANGVVVTDLLDEDTTFFVASADNGGTCAESGGVVTCELGAIAPGPGNGTTVTVVADVSGSASSSGVGGDGPCDGSEDLCNEVAVSAITNDPAPTNNVAAEPTGVVAGAPLELVKAFEDGEVAQGEPSSFTLTVSNTGDGDLNDVVVTDPVDHRLTVTAVDCAGTPVAATQDVACAIGVLGSGDEAVVTVEFVALGEDDAPTPAIAATAAVTAETCQPGSEPNRDGVCTSTTIRPVASCWEADGTQMVAILNSGSTDIGVEWGYLGESGEVAAAPGVVTNLVLTGGPSYGELSVSWSSDQIWWIDIGAETCAAGPFVVDNTATVSATSGGVEIGDEDSDSVTVIPGGAVDQPPVAAFTTECTGLECSFTDASTDVDGDLVSWAWAFGDGSASTDRNPVHTYAAPGTYDVTLIVTDNDDLTDSTTSVVAFDPATMMHVADIDSVSAAGTEDWDAYVIVTIEDTYGFPVQDATVEADWGDLDTGSCVTGDEGWCLVTLNDLDVDEVEFTITDVTHPNLEYDPSANTDPDGDSDGTSIIVAPPPPIEPT